MTNSPFRAFDHEKDIEAVQRIWIECGWINDDKDEREITSQFFKAGETEVATIEDVAECACHWTPGSVQYQEETLALGAVTAVTTSHLARRLGFARILAGRSLARQYQSGMEVSALGIFDQGFYNQLGYGNGPYENYVQFDPNNLIVTTAYRTPKRLSVEDYQTIHQAMSHRRLCHGNVVLAPEEILRAELKWTEKPFGLGYFDGPDGSLSHFIWGSMKGENGPYRITIRAYQTIEQLKELLALIKSMGDQVNSFKTLEFGEFQLQDLLKQPFRSARSTRGGEHEQRMDAFAYWQVRMLNLEACLAKTHLRGPSTQFNLRLRDPLEQVLSGETNWQGLSGEYVVTLGPECSATKGKRKNLPTLDASINAFSRLWFGVRPASHLAISDDLHGSPQLIAELDSLIRLPKPHFGWDF